jgi:TnpA family transposase
MLRTLLSPSQRAELFTIPSHISEQALVQQYTFSAADLALIKAQREEHNRLGFAVQLAYLRFPGRPLQAGEIVPASLLSYLAAQLQLSPLVLRRYAERDTTRRQHVRKIHRYLQLHQLTAQDEQVLQTLILPVALQTGSNIAVVTALLGHMRQKKISIPAVSSINP